ncbi:MAG: cytochrome c biogenesis protein ResB, partial [Chloroflexota bacterium]
DGRETRHSAGVVVFVEEMGPGVSVRAVDEEGQPLGLQLTAEAEPSLELLIALPEDRYFAVPEAELIVHLTPQSESPYTLLDVRIYRSPPGEIIAETVTGEGGQMELATERATLELTAAPYSAMTVSRNPGRWAAGCGVILLMAGLAGGLMWPERRFWLREGEEGIEIAGGVPGWMHRAGE